jgi:hypothetical protein
MDPKDRKKVGGYLKGAAMSPLAQAPALMPLRAALIGASGALEAPEGGSVRDVGLVGAAAPAVSSTLDVAGEVLGRDVAPLRDIPDQAASLLFGEGIEEAKRAKRAAEGAHAHGTAGKARTDPASGTQQGASQRYPGTGTAATRTAETGGITTGEPGSVRAGVGGEMYHAGDPRLTGLVDADDFVTHRTRGGKGPGDDFYERGPESKAGHGGALWTRSSVPEATQIRSQNRLARGLEAESQQFLTDIAGAEAAEAKSAAEEARAGVLAEQPMLPETIAARAKIGEADIEAASREAERSEVKTIVAEAAAQIDRMQQDPRFMALSPAQQKELEDRIWEQARLALSALTRTNLYPRPDPYAFLGMMGTPAAPAEEKQNKE